MVLPDTFLLIRYSWLSRMIFEFFLAGTRKTRTEKCFFVKFCLINLCVKYKNNSALKTHFFNRFFAICCHKPRWLVEALPHFYQDKLLDGYVCLEYWRFSQKSLILTCIRCVCIWCSSTRFCCRIFGSLCNCYRPVSILDFLLHELRRLHLKNNFVFL